MTSKYLENLKAEHAEKKALEKEAIEQARLDKHVLTQSDKKEASKESIPESREKLKEMMKNSLKAAGPQYVPKHLMNPDYVYAFDMLDAKKPFKFHNNLTIGYTHVTHDEMPGYKETVGQYQGGFSMIDDGGRIGVKYSDSQTIYLMKIPRERYEIIEELREEERLVPIQGLDARSKKEGYFGEITVGSASNALSARNYTTKPPQQ